jgi:Carboxypeptidase regulatory-like domain
MKFIKISVFAGLLILLSFLDIGAQQAPEADPDLVDLIDTVRPNGGNTGKDLFFGLPEAAPEFISTNYSFGIQSGIPLEDMSTGTTQLISGGTDNNNSGLAFMGLLLRYEGENITFFGANSNGFIRLGAAAPTGTGEINAIASTANSPKIAPFWDDLCVGNAGKVHYKTLGASPDKKLVIEWTNMKISRGANCDGSGTGTFQLWIYEHSGVIQFVYGPGMTAAAGNGGYSVGLQSGASTNFASISTLAGTVDYITPNDTQADAIPAGTSYLFSPNLPAAPTAVNVTNLSHATARFSWQDNADNETAYLVRRSTTGAADSYILAATLPANATTFSDSGLLSDQQYFYIINAVSDSAVSMDAILNVTTLPPANVSSTSTGGPWSSPSTWSNGIVPAPLDNVVIASGATVIIDTNAVAGSLAVGSAAASPPAILKYDQIAFRTLTVGGNVTIGANDMFTAGDPGNVVDNVLSVGGNLTNNGTLDFSTSNNQAGAGIVFTGNTSNVFSGTGTLTDVRTITVSKGAVANVLELSPSNFTVQGSTSDTAASGYLNLQAGMFKIGGTFQGVHRTFSTVGTISAVKGFWLSNPNYTVVAQGGFFLQGTFRVSAGTLSVGTGVGHSLITGPGSTVILEGGRINVAGMFGTNNYQSSQAFTYQQSGGALTACMTPGPTLVSCFELGLANWTGWMTGGEIVIQNHNTATGGIDYRNERGPGPTVIAGTTLRFGNASTAGVQSFRAIGQMPNVVVDTTGGAHTVFLFQAETGINASGHDLFINSGGTFDVQGISYTVLGDTVVNNGIIKANAPGSNLILGNGTSLEDIVYSGTGITSIMTRLTTWCRTLTLNQTNNMRVRNLSVDAGDISNANKLTIGNNDSTLNTITFGVPGTLPPSGTLDTSPVFELGTGGQSLAYVGPVAGIARSTGPEINPDRSLVELNYDDNGSLVLTGGDLTVTNLLKLTRGELATGSNKVILTNGFTRTAGYINGAVRWRIANTGLFTFPVGQPNAYTPAAAAVSAVNVNPSFLTVNTVDATLPGLLPAASASRYWHLEHTGGLVATLAFTYANSDVNGVESNYALWQSSGGAPVQVAGGTVNTGTNTVTGPPAISALNGDWGIGAQDAGPVTISGSVTTANGAGIRNAIVTLSGGNLPGPVVRQTGSFGTYLFENVQAGQTYTVQVSAKRFRFAVTSQVVTPIGHVANLNFVANPQEEF